MEDKFQVLESQLQNNDNYIIVRADTLEKMYQLLKLCDKYRYRYEALETGIHRLVKK